MPVLERPATRRRQDLENEGVAVDRKHDKVYNVIGSQMGVTTTLAMASGVDGC